MTQATGQRPDDGYAWAGGHGSQDAPSGATPNPPTGPDELARGDRPGADREGGGATQPVPTPGETPGQPGYQGQPGNQGQPGYTGWAGYQPPQGFHGSGGSGAPGGSGGTAPQPPQPPAPGPGYGGSFTPPPPAPPTSHERRGPGWVSVGAIGVGAAVLASLITAGVVNHTDDTANVSASTSTSQSAQPAPVTSSNAKNPDWGAVASAVEPSVVAVTVTGQSGAGEGSGVLLDKTGRVITNNHVVSLAGGGGTVKVTLWDGRTYPASIAGTDASTDLAVIKITKPPADLRPAVLGSSSDVKVGDPVMAVGNPLGLAGTVTTGIVSATDRPTTTQAESSDPFSQQQGETVFTNSIQTDAAVNPGNSGGALVDAQGRVIGIPSSIASLGSGQLGGSSQSGSIGLGFAIPIDEVKDVSSQLAGGGTVKHAWLGVQPDDTTVTVGDAQRDAALLRTIVSGSPAAKAGLKSGDAVIAVDGDSVNSAASLVGRLREQKVDTSVTLQVVRAGKTLNVKVTLGTAPAQQQ